MGLNVTLLGSQISCSLRFHDCLPGATKRASPNRLCASLCPGDIGLSLRFALLYTHNILHVRTHVACRYIWIGKVPRAYVLRWPHLERLQIRVKVGLCSLYVIGPRTAPQLVLGNTLRRLHAETLERGGVYPLRAYVLRWPHLIVLQVRAAYVTSRLHGEIAQLRGVDLGSVNVLG